MSGIKQESIKNIIDKNIIDLINAGNGFNDLKENLHSRSTRMRNKFYKDILLCSDVCDMDPDMLLYNEYYWDMITSSRIRYAIYYISHCERRIEGINWIIKNRIKLSEYSRVQLFNLVKLKELLENNEREYYEKV